MAPGTTVGGDQPRGHDGLGTSIAWLGLFGMVYGLCEWRTRRVASGLTPQLRYLPGVLWLLRRVPPQVRRAVLRLTDLPHASRRISAVAAYPAGLGPVARRC